MLDTYGRKYVNPIIDLLADLFLSFGLKPNTVTFVALIIGIFTFPLILMDMNILAVILLWTSGLLDAVDGAMARKLTSASALGSLMDLTFDRIVEISIIISLALKYPDARLSLIVLLSVILISMTIFLSVGALAEKKGIKSFYYQAGVAERTEGFIMFSFMIVFSNYILYITTAFILIIIITIFQRAVEAVKIIK